MIYDISYCQKGLRLENLTSCDKVIIRLGVHDHRDTECVKFVLAAERLNIPFDFYWYVTSDTAAAAALEGKAIATVYKDVLKTCKINRDIFVWLDIEDVKTMSASSTTIPIFRQKMEKGGIPEKGIGLYAFKAAIVPPYQINITNPFIRDLPLWVAWWKEQEPLAVKTLFPTAKYWQRGKRREDGMEVDYNYTLEDLTIFVCPDNEDQLDTITLYTSSRCGGGIPYRGHLWRYDDKMFNGRIRVTNAANRIGALPLTKNVTGWVMLSEFERYKGRKG